MSRAHAAAAEARKEKRFYFLNRRENCRCLFSSFPPIRIVFPRKRGIGSIPPKPMTQIDTLCQLFIPHHSTREKKEIKVSNFLSITPRTHAFQRKESNSPFMQEIGFVFHMLLCFPYLLTLIEFWTHAVASRNMFSFSFLFFLWVWVRIHSGAKGLMPRLSRLVCPAKLRHTHSAFPPPRKKEREKGRYDFWRHVTLGGKESEREKGAKWNFDCFHSIMPLWRRRRRQGRSFGGAGWLGFCSKLPPFFTLRYTCWGEGAFPIGATTEGAGNNINKKWLCRSTHTLHTHIRQSLLFITARRALLF